MTKRTEVYVLRPKQYEMAGCKCGNDNPQWSEFQGHLWCAKCEIDFVPKHSGVFDGPIPINGAHLMGLCFATVNIETGYVTPCDSKLCVAGRVNFLQDEGVDDWY